MEMHRRSKAPLNNEVDNNNTNSNGSTKRNASGSSLRSKHHSRPGNPYTAASQTTTTDIILFRSIQILLAIAVCWFLSLIFSVDPPASNGDSLRGSGSAPISTVLDPKDITNARDQIWKSTASSCEASPVHLEMGWYKSQSGEDRALQKWFKDICHGTYLEIGGLDGIRYSNSYLYNKGLNWTGVLVEASPRNFQQLVVNRPNEIANVHAGVCEKEMDLHLVESRPAVGGFQEFAAPEFQKKWWSKDQIQNAQVVKCRTLEHILLNITNAGPRFYFDFFSLDVEGAELSVLRSVNFDVTAFGVIFVEADGRNETKDIEVRVFLESNGYTFFEDKSRSLWFLNNDFWDIYEGLIHS